MDTPSVLVLFRACVIEQDSCPECLGSLDTGHECNVCNFDARPEWDEFLEYLKSLCEED